MNNLIGKMIFSVQKGGGHTDYIVEREIEILTIFKDFSDFCP